MPFSDWKTEVEAGDPAETSTARPSLFQNALLLLLLLLLDSGQIQNLFFSAQQEAVLFLPSLNSFSPAAEGATHPMSFSLLVLPFLRVRAVGGVPHGSHEMQVAAEVPPSRLSTQVVVGVLLSLRETQEEAEVPLSHP